MMRSLLVWLVYGLIPDSSGFSRRESDYTDQPVPKSILWSFITAMAMAMWLVLLMYLSVVWRDRLDCYFMAFAKWGEDVMLGKKPFISGITWSFGNMRSRFTAKSEGPESAEEKI
jgi:hypothetical protein